MLRPIESHKAKTRIERFNLGKNKIVPFTSAVLSDYYKGINQPEAKSCNTVTIKSLTDTGKTIFLGDRFNG
jgi:hypothetical protein